MPSEQTRFASDASAKRAYTRFAAWMHDHALPFWSSTGCDPDGLGFTEHLSLDGRRAAIPYKRVRVQARQIYVFSHAALLGWKDGRDIASSGYRFLIGHGRREDGGWARQLGRHGGIVDPTADLYDHAFVLFALAWYARATGSDEAIYVAHETLAWINRNMRSVSGGFHNTNPIGNDPRQQNPHMHLLEALLALYETTGDASFRTAAYDLLDLFQERFFDSATGTLGEFFQDDWTQAPGAVGSHIEPGHHYEWVWLLHQAERLTGRSFRREADALYRFANRFGPDTETGLICDVVDRAGNIRDKSFRLWPQTEAIKAHIVATEGGMATREIGALLELIVGNLLDHFLKPAPNATWIDHLNADFTVKSDKIPSSSLYHLFMAFGEMARIMRAPRPNTEDAVCLI